MAKPLPRQATHAPLHLAPPTGGINALSAGADITPPTDCVYCYNLFPSRYGMRPRPGYVKWGERITDGVGGVRTLIPYNATIPTASKLFAVTADGIYEITTGGTPTKKFDFLVKTSPAGWCSWTSFANLAGDYLLICDEANGYIVYDAGADTFAAGSLTGADPATMAQVTVWKNRLWLVERDSQRAWYLNTVGTIAGAVTAFEFGAKFKYGGKLVGIWNWTTDGGAGIDDHLVAISSQGDVAVYTGWDPTTAIDEGSFQMKGVWYLGETPEGRRGVLEDGGDLLVLTATGVLSLTQLVSGSGRSDESRYYLTDKINTLLRQVWQQRLGLRGWEITSLPRYAALVLAQPTLSNERPLQWFYSYERKGWFFMRGVPIQTIDNWGTRVFFGDTTGQVWELAGLLDKVDPADPTSGDPIEFSLLTSYQAYGSAPHRKKVEMIVPRWIGTALPQYAVMASYDYATGEVGEIPPSIATGGSEWDASVWGGAMWGGGNQTSYQPYGATGMGHYVALAMRGQARGDCAYMGADLIVSQGGLL